MWDVAAAGSLVQRRQPGILMIIDGNHRIARAIREGLTWLPAHFLSKEDEQHCRLGNERDSFAEHVPWHARRGDVGPS